ncbi:BatD family protein [Glaciecola sp. SC05]|uniref:BatD family protein n=1 Tax=Glaciecola sp. SC05 TaxID=1987355 RepID=UPI0035296037
MKSLYWSFWFLLALVSHYASAELTSLTATIDKNPILLDESVTLQITAVGGAESDAIDFSVLTRSFRVGQPSVSQSTQIINFDRTTTTTWTLQLFPRGTGKLTIPAFRIDQQVTDPIILNVLPVTEANLAQPRDFYVTTQVSSAQVYLQQQVQYQVKIYLAVDIQRGSLTEPVLDNAVIEQLGDDKEYQELVNGVRYRVIERNFAVLPQASGNYIIDGPVFQAEVLAGSRQNFAFFNRSKTINRVAPSIELTVLPIPESYPFLWLPSEQVQVSEQWQGNDNEFVQGEPITRTITINALGLIDEQLPAIEAQYHPSFKTYPEQPERATIKQDSRLIAQLVQSTAIIPSQTGTFVLPEISIPWFDVNSGETKFAVVPAKTVNVIAPVNQASDASQLSGAAISEATPVDLLPEQAEKPASDGLFPVLIYGLDALHISLIAALVVLIIMMLLLYRKTPTVAAVKETAQIPISDSEATAWQQLNQAIDSKNTKALQACLRAWLQSLTRQHIQSLNNTLIHLDASDAAEAFNGALASQYSETTGSFDVEALKQTLTRLREREQHRRDSQSRTNMYPIT